MTTLGPGSGDASGEPEGTPGVPEEVWQKFLTDSEDAIRGSAPREPSARERVPGWFPGPPDTAGARRWAERPYGGRGEVVTGAVGDLWQPEEPRGGSPWRELDRRARLRRVGRMAGTAAAVALALAAWSRLPAGSGAPGDGPGPATVRQLEDAPGGLPTAAARPVGSPAGGAGGTGPTGPDGRCVPSASWSPPPRQPEPWSCG
ncbi:hypothetical protein SUDANB6_01928 [Streptomyces sp. enrichment culture]|uniref:hypothetical protein n=1 Tax=Streptomyces sp. enrichment culture TaxID=1795815 RepID=UPI003F55E047